ncbi:uncharacterized protein C10orf143 homolog isoform X7 [Notamacropus eugenii]|uniref:uncharacterized protein C10orf143 homolog isoform X7 n=1 Tax=Notamacropus eugenii TaxID=9315 RepID=UPI003B67BBB2
MCVLLLSHLGSASGMVFQVDSFWDNAERLNPDNKKRTCRRIDAGLGENELAQACWITDWGSESKGFIAQECLPGNLQGRQSSVIAADNGRRPTQPCSRCLAGESTAFVQGKMRMYSQTNLDLREKAAGIWIFNNIRQ